MAAMGQFYVTARLTGAAGRGETLELLVDTGATLLVVPQPLAFLLDLVPLRSQAVVLAGGGEETWPVAEVRLALEGREATTPCFIAPAGPALLGAVALESLFLGVDPVANRLVPVKGYAAGTQREAAASRRPARLAK
jgi:predicted aspartyl protease